MNKQLSRRGRQPRQGWWWLVAGAAGCSSAFVCDSRDPACVGGSEDTDTGTPRVEDSAPASTERLQFGLNYIPFYGSGEQDRGELDTDTEWVQPDWITGNATALGAQALRQLQRADLTWATVQPSAEGWNWAVSDAVLLHDVLEQEPTVLLFGMKYASANPPWTAAADPFQRTLGAEARTYLETVVDRYADVVRYWEIGNEMDAWENTDPESTAGSEMPANAADVVWTPEEQGVFLAEAAAIVRERDPDAIIVLPGMHPSSYAAEVWLPGVVAGGGTTWFDIVNYHYYNRVAAFSDFRDLLGTALETLGIEDKPVWLTETGLSWAEPQTETIQAEELTQRFVQAFAAGDDTIFWHTWMSGSAAESFYGYGLLDRSANTKLAWHSYRFWTQEIAPVESAELIEESSRHKVYTVTRSDGRVQWIAWGISINWTTPTGTSEQVTLVSDADGNFTVEPVSAGTILTLSPAPILVR